EMAAFRKKPVVIEATQFEGTMESANRVLAWIGSHGGYATRAHMMMPEKGIIIHTLEGNMTAAVGDWVIKGTKGEFYPCKPDIFVETYEPATPLPTQSSMR
ncbi:hypothetical protein, partial [Kaistia sp. MMO-174]|uniref:hypothetical protein n=1 Tax=Kaistia sp. MMO-174 TaxID=3081256 RepID=UPI003018A5A2